MKEAVCQTRSVARTRCGRKSTRESFKAVAKVRGAQKVFPTTAFDNDPINDVITFPALTTKEGRTKPFVEVFREFPLTSAQVSKETEKRAGRTLARMAAKEIALAWDTAQRPRQCRRILTLRSSEANTWASQHSSRT